MKLHEILQKLAAARLITLTGDKYELTHDTLAKLIAGKRSVEEQAVIDWENLLRNKLLGVKQSGTSDCLTVAQLEGLKPYLHKLQLNAEEQQFLQESQVFRAKEAEAERRRLLMLILFFVGLSLVVLVALFWAVYQGRIVQRELNRNEKIVAGMYFYKDRFALCVKKDSSGHFKYGFMDKEGNVRVPYEYDEAVQFDEYGYARVKIKGELYLIDTLNNRYPLAESLVALDNHILALSLKEQHLKELPKEILENPQLKILYLRGNKLKDLPMELGGLECLIILDLGYNNLVELPQNLENLTKLKIIDLQNNNLHQFESVLFKLLDLEILNLSNNTIGDVPFAIGQLKNLKVLDLSHNNISNISKKLASLPKIHTINLYRNELDSIPEELINRTELNLNIGGNRMNTQTQNSFYRKEKSLAQNTNSKLDNRLDTSKVISTVSEKNKIKNDVFWINRGILDTEWRSNPTPIRRCPYENLRLIYDRSKGSIKRYATGTISILDSKEITILFGVAESLMGALEFKFESLDEEKTFYLESKSAAVIFKIPISKWDLEWFAKHIITGMSVYDVNDNKHYPYSFEKKGTDGEFRKQALCLYQVLFSQTPSNKIDSICIKVLDETTKKPLKNAKVMMQYKDSKKNNTLTVNEVGEVKIKIPDQDFNLQGRCTGYLEESVINFENKKNENGFLEGTLLLKKITQ